MKLSHFARRALFTIGLVVYALLFGEAFVRIADPQVLLPRYVTGTPWGIRGNIPNAHYWHWTPEVNVEFKINSQGMRADRDYPLEKPSGTCRLALFGDSFFMGYELDLKNTFATKLEKQLQADHFNLEVLNFSVSGFGTAEMIRSYENFGHRFAPDIVIFQWHSTDFDDNVRSDLFELKDDQLVETGKAYLPTIELQDVLMKSSIYRFVADHSHLYSFLRERAANSVKALIVAYNNQAPKVDASAATGQVTTATPGNHSSYTPYAIKLSAALLQYARQMMHVEDQEFFVVEIPDQINRISFKSSLEEFPVDNLSRLNIISPLKAFERLASPQTKLYYEQGHYHITPLAVDALVGVVAPRLEQSPHLQKCRTGQ